MSSNKDWFSENIRKYKNDLYALAFSILRNNEDVNDAVQETLYKAYDKLDTLKDPDKFKPWIMRILANSSYEILRGRKKTVSIDEYENTLESTSGIYSTTNAVLWDAVQSLDAKYRTVVVLFYYNDLPIKEIAKILELKPATVRKRLSRAREQLRTFFSYGEPKGRL